MINFGRLCAHKTIKTLMLLALVSSASAVNAKSATPNEIKAALIFKMGMFVNWKNPPPVKNYCFVGELGNTLGQILTHRAKEGKLPVPINITLEATLDKIERYQCQVLFIYSIDESQREKMQSLSQSTLTLVGNASELKNGGIVSIEIENRRPRLYASKSNLKNSNIEIHSRLLSTMTLLD